MNMDDAARTTSAVLAQLKAEVAASDHTVKSLAAEMGVDYNTFRRYFTGERDLPMTTLWQALSALSLPIDVFTARAKERLEQS